MSARSILDNCWEQVIDINLCFPQEIAKWIDYKATVNGVPTTYIAWPVLAVAAHASQHTDVHVEDLHSEPTLLYTMVAGRSGTNKSGALGEVLKELTGEPQGQSIFRGGSLDGLMKLIQENNGIALGVFDELCTFLDSIDKGSTGNQERGTFLQLFSAIPWSKHTKTVNNVEIDNPRFNLISYTQCANAIAFAQKPDVDGFFQRFLVTLPYEVGVMAAEKRSRKAADGNSLIDMKEVFRWIHSQCRTKRNLMCDEDACNAWDTIHDEIVSFRLGDRYTDIGISARGKCLGLTLRIAGIITLLREAVSGVSDENYQLVGDVSLNDFHMGGHIADYSAIVSMALENNQSVTPITPDGIDSSGSSSSSSPSTPQTCRTRGMTQGIPNPDAMTMEFLIHHRSHVLKILTRTEVPLSQVTGNNMYPVINREKGGDYALKFVKGLCYLGLGRVEQIPGRKHGVFKRYHPDDEVCPDREEVRAKWDNLSLQI